MISGSYAVFIRRTRSRIESGSEQVEMDSRVEFYEPFGFFDFVKLEQHAVCAITDSGTVQEECCLFGVPTVTIRQTTERPETIDCGSNVVCGLKAQRIEEAAAVMMALPANGSARKAICIRMFRIK